MAEQDNEGFLKRWSRLKEEARATPAVPTPADPSHDEAPALPPVEDLDLESDYRAFFHPKVGEELRRRALKKLFSDPHFQAMDGLDVYIDDYSKSEALSPAVLEKLEQARKIFGWAREPEEMATKAAAGQAPVVAADAGSDSLPKESDTGEIPNADAKSDPEHRP